MKATSRDRESRHSSKEISWLLRGRREIEWYQRTADEIFSKGTLLTSIIVFEKSRETNFSLNVETNFAKKYANYIYEYKIVFIIEITLNIKVMRTIEGKTKESQDLCLVPPLASYVEVGDDLRRNPPFSPESKNRSLQNSLLISRKTAASNGTI